MTPPDLYPPIEPHQIGLLPVGDGHQIYWEVSGNPAGEPILFVHGGPGAGCQPLFRRFFDPKKWRIILFDQRGCGYSTPHADLTANTTQHLVSDMEFLRIHLGVEQWVLFGGSWGSTLALVYGQTHPDRVLSFILRGIFLCRPVEIQWFMQGMGTFFPEAWERFKNHLSSFEQTHMLEAYSKRLNHPDPLIHGPAARVWYGYEEACARLIPKNTPAQPDPLQALAMARLECHYMINAGFLGADQILSNILLITHISCVIVQGRYDVVCPPVTAIELASKWPGSRLIMIPDAGHSGLETGTRTALISAVDEIYGLIKK